MSTSVLCVALLSLLFVRMSIGERGKSRLTIVKEVVEGVRNCQHPTRLDRIRLEDVNIKHLIVGTDVFDVQLQESKLAGVDGFQIDSISESGEEYLMAITIPKADLESLYTAHGIIGDTFPVDGRGGMKISYTNVTLTLALTLEANNQNVTIAEEGLSPSNLHFEEYALKVSTKSSESIEQKILRKGFGKSGTEHSQVAQLLFWKLSFLNSKQLKPLFYSCINRGLSLEKNSFTQETTVTSNRSRAMNRSVHSPTANSIGSIAPPRQSRFTGRN